MLKKYTTRGRMIRRTHKNCIKELGKERFNFDYKDELIKYKYLCGVKIKRREYVRCVKNCFPYSYQQWKDYIVKKYSIYSKSQLEEFSRYLELGVRDNNMARELQGIVFAALLSSMFAILFGNIILPFAEVVNSIWGLLALIIILFVLVIPEILLFIYVVYKPIRNRNLEEEMYSDYRKIINEIIKEK